MRASLLVALLLVGLPLRLAAQGASLRYAPRPSPGVLLDVVGGPAPSIAESVTFAVGFAARGSTDYRWEVGITGAALVGLIGLVAVNAGCNSDNSSGGCIGSSIGAAAVGSLIGGVIGLFVGSAIEKQTGPTAEAEARLLRPSY